MTTVTLLDETPRDRIEAAERLGEQRSLVPVAERGRIRIRFTTGGYIIVRVDP